MTTATVHLSSDLPRRLARLVAVEEVPVSDVEVDGTSVLRFADGIPGFADAHRFVLADLTEDGTFQLLSSVDDPSLSLVVTSPWLFFPDYAPDLPAGDQRVLGIEQPEDAVVFCTAIADDTDELHLNLRAPFVVNAHTHAARQVVLDEDLPLRATIPGG